MIARQLVQVVTSLRRGYPAIAITGPRQSGKTTLAKQACAELPLVDFESPLERVEFEADPQGFLRRFPNGGIFDEIQHVPDLLSYLKVKIDAEGTLGRWILTGSQQLELGRDVSQSLAGRVALLELLPLSYAEMTAAERQPRTLSEAVFRGGYPVLYDANKDVSPSRWLEDYIATFIARDVRAILDITMRSAFDRFVRSCAARTGQLLNIAELSRDCGITGKTGASWLSVLEACYLIRLVKPHFKNFGKRLAKHPKLYFVDSGLACRLLHISDVNQLKGHVGWGALVETWCFGELVKSRLNSGLPPSLWYWRSNDGLEVDAMLETGTSLYPWEIKASETVQRSDLAGISKLREFARRDSGITLQPGTVIYGGDERRPVGDDRFVPWWAIAETMPSMP